MATVTVDKKQWEIAQKLILASQNYVSNPQDLNMIELARSVGRWEGALQ